MTSYPATLVRRLQTFRKRTSTLSIFLPIHLLYIPTSLLLFTLVLLCLTLLLSKMKSIHVFLTHTILMHSNNYYPNTAFQPNTLSSSIIYATVSQLVTCQNSRGLSSYQTIHQWLRIKMSSWNTYMLNENWNECRVLSQRKKLNASSEDHSTHLL